MGDEEFDQAKSVLEGHDDTVFGIAITPDGKTVASGSSDNTIKIWDLATNRCRLTIRVHIEPIIGIAITPDGSKVLSDSNDWNYLMKLREKG